MTRDTLLDFFHDFAALEDEFLIHDDGFQARHFRYSEIAARARAFAAGLRERGIGRDEKIILYGENRPEWIIALWGCLLAGVIAVPIDNRSSPEFVERVQSIVGARLVLTGEEAVNGQATYVLDLTAKKRGTSYQQIRYWVATDTLLPVKAEFTLTSGKASKMTEFEEYRTVQGRRLLTRQVIYDLLRNEQQTVIEYRNYEGRPLPDKMFNQSFLREY